MYPITRRYDDPVGCLPSKRSSIYDRHHLFWPGADLRRRGFAEFRSLACASASHLDSMIHSLVHQRFSGVLTLNDDELVDLRLRSNRCVERHYLRSCACWSSRRLCVVDALDLSAGVPRNYDGTPCSAMLVDGQIYELMRDYYQAVAPITEAVRLQLVERCDTGACACMVSRGGQILRQPAIWNQLRLIAV